VKKVLITGGAGFIGRHLADGMSPAARKAFGFDPTTPPADGLAQTWAWSEASHGATPGPG
jgi:UDP-glucose 4-epimerase